MCNMHILSELPFYTYKVKFTFDEARKGKRCHRAPHCSDSSCILGHPASSYAAYCCDRGDSVSSICSRVVGALYVDMNKPVSYTHLRAHETDSYLVCRLLLEKKKKKI